MNSLSKVVVLFAILGIIGAGLFFYPGSPFYYANIVVVEAEAVDQMEDNMDSDGNVDVEIETNN